MQTIALTAHGLSIHGLTSQNCVENSVCTQSFVQPAVQQPIKRHQGRTLSKLIGQLATNGALLFAYIYNIINLLCYLLLFFFFLFLIFITTFFLLMNPSKRLCVYACVCIVTVKDVSRKRKYPAPGVIKEFLRKEKHLVRQNNAFN